MPQDDHASVPEEGGAASPLPVIGMVTLAELFECLHCGIADFRAAPLFGLFFASVYVIAGFLLLWFGAGTLPWTLTLSLGFPLVAPFAAVGLYDVSKKLEAGTPLIWREVLGVVLAERHRQIPWAGAIILIYFLFWTFLAHMLFALVMGPSALMSGDFGWQALTTPRALTLVALELVVGGALAFLLFALTVVGLPLLLEREIDFVTAMLLSMRTVRHNLGVMLVWALIVAALTLVALVPMFLGLLVVLPVLGHASWHIYRRALYDPA